ncbi:hypothetical protein GEO60473_31720 [Geobacter sp. 60473]|nr:hypothetical protein GEO60473_31720 [Geobacter sp. 60473]
MTLVASCFITAIWTDARDLKGALRENGLMVSVYRWSESDGGGAEEGAKLPEHTISCLVPSL